MSRSAPFPVAGCQPATGAGAVSSGRSPGVFAGRLPVKSRRPALDPHGMHREFPAIWSRYLRDHYGTNRGAIMMAFAVDDRTVRSWQSGLNMPSGNKVALAAARHPEFFAAIEVAA
jgi:hypothetical protein